MTLAAPNPIQAPLALIIDLDGTLIDTQADFVAALNLMLDDLRLPPIDGGFVAQTVGKGSEHLVAQTLKQVCAEPARFELAMQRYQRHYLAINGRHAEVYPGVLDGLQRFAEMGLPMACLTNKPSDFALPLLAGKGLSRFFSHIFGGDAFARKKPDPLPLIKTCEALGTAPERTWMIGDSSNDAQAARAAGCPVAMVSYGYNHGRPIREVDADAFIDRLDELNWG